MVGLSTKARLISASATPSPARTARTASRMRPRSMGTASWGVAMEMRLMVSCKAVIRGAGFQSCRERMAGLESCPTGIVSRRHGRLGLAGALDAEDGGLAALVQLDAGGQDRGG